MIDFENISLTDARTKLAKIADIVEGTIDHCDLEDAMDMLYQVKDVVERNDKHQRCRSCGSMNRYPWEAAQDETD